MKTVCVLLSAYNGEKYISEQIDSILAQEGVDVHLIVRDDGSTDSTLTILQSYKEKGKLDFIVGENIGWKKSFMELLFKASPADYYAFSDQDDYWLPEKLQVAVEQLETMGKGPNLYCSNTYYWRQGEPVSPYRTDKVPTAKDYILIWILTQGCTFVFTKQLLSQIITARPSIDTPHDVLVMRAAAMMGDVYYDSTPHIWYRQHGDNTVGATKGLFAHIKRIFREYYHVDNDNLLSRQIKDLYDCYESYMSEDCKQLCLLIINYRHGFKNYLRLLLSRRFVAPKPLTTLGLKYRILLKKL